MRMHDRSLYIRERVHLGLDWFDLIDFGSILTQRVFKPYLFLCYFVRFHVQKNEEDDGGEKTNQGR